MPTSTALTISIYGAGLSTVLAIWHFWRAFQERRWISTSYNFRGIDDPGNDVILINNSPKPLTLYNIQLFWGRRYLFWLRRYRRVGEDPWGAEDSDTGVKLDPFSITILPYAEDRHFDWRNEQRPKARLFLRANIVGRIRPMTLFVYRQDRWQPTMVTKLLSWLGFDTGFSNIYVDERKGDDSLLD